MKLIYSQIYDFTFAGMIVHTKYHDNGKTVEIITEGIGHKIYKQNKEFYFIAQDNLIIHKLNHLRSDIAFHYTDPNEPIRYLEID